MDSSSLAAADYAVVIGFFAVMIFIGLYFSRQMKNMSDFFGGGKSVPWWLAGISFYMCTFSAAGFVMYSAIAYQYGWVSVTIWWALVPSLMLSARLFASRWRRVAETSPLEYIEHRYGNVMRQGLVWLGLPIRILDDGLKLLAIGIVVAAGMGFPLKPAIIGSGLIMVSYTFMGGLWAALVADFIQFVVLVAAVVVLPFLAFARPEIGGIAGFIDKVPEGFFHLTAAKYSWKWIAALWVIGFLNYSTSWAWVQRYYSVDSDKNARKVGYMVAFLNIIGPPLFFLPAMAAVIFLPNIKDFNSVYPIMCKAVLPIGMLGMVIAAMFAATMSMLAGDFNAIASVLTNDVFKRLISPKASNKTLLAVSRINTLIVGGVIIGVTFLVQKAQGADDLIQVMVKIFALFVPPVAIPMLLGMLTKRVSTAGGLLGLIGGMAAGLVAFLLATGPYPWLFNLDAQPRLLDFEIITLITCLATLAGIVIGTIVRPDSAVHKEKIDEFFLKVNNVTPPQGVQDIQAQPAEQTAEEAKAKISPLPIIGIGVIAIGVILTGSVIITVPLAESVLSTSIGVSLTVVGVGFCVLGHKVKKMQDK